MAENKSGLAEDPDWIDKLPAGQLRAALRAALSDINRLISRGMGEGDMRRFVSKREADVAKRCAEIAASSDTYEGDKARDMILEEFDLPKAG